MPSLSSEPARLSLEFASDFAYLESTVEAMQAFLRNVGVEEDLTYRVVLLASEAVTNAIEHGNKLDASKKVRLEVVVTADFIELSVQDEGRGFEPDGVADPLEQENLLSVRGRGLFFMEEMADEVDWELGGRRVRLVFHYPS